MTIKNCDKILASAAKPNTKVDDFCFNVSKSIAIGFFVLFAIFCAIDLATNGSKLRSGTGARVSSTQSENEMKLQFKSK